VIITAEVVAASAVVLLASATLSAYVADWIGLTIARAAARSLENDTYELPPALVRWIEPGGLPYAIVEDYSALPKDIRDNVDVAARFGRTAVVKRRGAVSCAP
jgi:hypothetical protein